MYDFPWQYDEAIYHLGESAYQIVGSSATSATISLPSTWDRRGGKKPQTPDEDWTGARNISGNYISALKHLVRQQTHTQAPIGRCAIHVILRTAEIPGETRRENAAPLERSTSDTVPTAASRPPVRLAERL